MAPITRSVARRSRASKFSSLPAELRLMVWEATFAPRILHITSETTYLPDSRRPRLRGCSRGPIPTHTRFKSPEKPPIALQICHESRTLALKHYIPSFHPSTSPRERASEMKQTAIYFNPELDTVHIECNLHSVQLSSLSYRTLTGTVQSIQALAIQLFDEELIGHIARCLLVYQSLKTLTLVACDETRGDWDGSSVRVNMEDELVKAQNQLVSQGSCKEWTLPEVKVMTQRVFENDF